MKGETMKAKGWVTRDEAYWKWTRRPKWYAQIQLWCSPDKIDGCSVRWWPEKEGRYITERTAIRLIGCRLKGGKSSIRRIKERGIR